MSERYDRLVVGAGLSGLADALHAKQRGARVHVLEAAPQVGGVVATHTRHGYRYEAAATSLPSSARELLALLASIGREDVLMPASEAAKAQFLLTSQGLERVPRSPTSMLRTRLLTFRGKLRAFGEVLQGRAEPSASETLFDFVARRFGHEIADGFLRPFTNGIYGCAPEKLGAADAFPRLVALEQRRGGVIRGLMAGGLGGSASAQPRGKREVLMPVDGMAAVPQALADALGEHVETGIEVTRVEAGTLDAAARVHTSEGRVLEAETLVLATRAPTQASLLKDSHPEIAAVLSNVQYVPMVVCAVGYARGAGPDLPGGFGFLRGPTSDARILGATFNSRLNPAVAPEGAALLSAFVGGSEDTTAVDLDDDALRAIVLADLQRALGAPIDPTVFEITRWRGAIPMFTPGHRVRMAEANAALGDARIHLLGSHVTGVSLNDCCRPGAPVLGPLPAGLARIDA